MYIVFVLGVHCTHTHKHTHSNGKFIIFSFYIDPIHSLRFNISFKYILHRILFGFFIDFAIVIQSTKVPVLVDVEPMVSVCVERRRYFAFHKHHHPYDLRSYGHYDDDANNNKSNNSTRFGYGIIVLLCIHA